MNTTRRGFIGWLAALFGGAAVAKAAPEPASLADMLPLGPDDAYRRGQLAAQMDAARVESGRSALGPFGYEGVETVTYPIGAPAPKVIDHLTVYTSQGPEIIGTDEYWAEQKTKDVEDIKRFLNAPLPSGPAKHSVLLTGITSVSPDCTFSAYVVDDKKDKAPRS